MKTCFIVIFLIVFNKNTFLSKRSFENQCMVQKLSFFLHVLTRTQVNYLTNGATFNNSLIVITYKCSVAGKMIHLVVRKTAVF